MKKPAVHTLLGSRALALLPVFAGAGALVSSCFPSYRDSFIDANYPEPTTAPGQKLFDPTVIEPLRVHATITPLLVSGYDDPNGAAACIRGYGVNAKLESLRAFGVCLAQSTPPANPSCVGPAATRWDACMATAFDGLSCSCNAPPAGCTAGPDGKVLSCSLAGASMPTACTTLGKPDQLRILTALGQTGEAMVAYELQTLGPHRTASETSVLSRPMPATEEALYHAAFEEAATELACDATNGAASCATSTTPVARKTQADAPVLALSGGAANGAYTAGYVYELLQARKAARATDPAAGNEKFSAVVGNSVGSLIAPLVDLALTDDTVSPASLEWCRKQLLPPPATAPASASECGLDLLERYMTQVNEWDLLCVEDASFMEFIQTPSDPNDQGKPSFGRFWPLEHDIAGPFYAQFGDVLMKNGVTRVVMTSETQSKTMQGLDERVCRSATASPAASTHSCSAGAPGTALDCLACGVLASIPNPLFARAPQRAWSGVRPEGEAGTYYDGGLRSTFPVLRAVELSAIRTDLAQSTPVLALSTERAQSNTSTAPRSGMELALLSLDSLTHETQHWELAYATLFEEQRRHRALLPSLAAAGMPACGLGTASPSATFGAVFANFMPAELEPARLSAAGYQFDPIVMKGLFIAGRRAFLEQATDDKRNVLAFLGWVHTKAELEKVGPSGKTWLAKRREDLEVQYTVWLSFFPKTDADWNAHVLDRRAQMKDKLQYCPN